MADKNKVAVITGGSRGLGRDMALQLAKEGYIIVFTYHSDVRKADETLKEIELLGTRAFAHQLDVRQLESFTAFRDALLSQLLDQGLAPHIHVLVNNAGTALYAPFEETTEEQIDDMFLTHYKSVYFLIQKLLAIMPDGGRIINISSGLARFAIPGSSGYGSMKGAVEVLTRYLAKELGGRNITVNAVAPGPIETDFGGGRTRDNKEINARLASMTALGRVGLPEDIGGIVAFLCSDAARWISGQRIEASGGMLL